MPNSGCLALLLDLRIARLSVLSALWTEDYWRASQVRLTKCGVGRTEESFQPRGYLTRSMRRSRS
jgi:hypothetical protein